MIYGSLNNVPTLYLPLFMEECLYMAKQAAVKSLFLCS